LIFAMLLNFVTKLILRTRFGRQTCPMPHSARYKAHSSRYNQSVVADCMGLAGVIPCRHLYSATDLVCKGMELAGITGWTKKAPRDTEGTCRGPQFRLRIVKDNDSIEDAQLRNEGAGTCLVLMRPCPPDVQDEHPACTCQIQACACCLCGCQQHPHLQYEAVLLKFILIIQAPLKMQGAN